MEAGDALTAVHMAQERVPDLVLLDLHLPEGSGEQVMDRLRRRSATAGIPIIIITGDPLANGSSLQMMGAHSVFRKPVEIHEFLAGIRAALHLPQESVGTRSASLPPVAEPAEGTASRHDRPRGGAAEFLSA